MSSRRRRFRRCFGVGDRVVHQKFGNGNVVAVDGNKLTINDKAGEKRVVDSFVERVVFPVIGAEPPHPVCPLSP